MRRLISRFLADDSGATAIEYGLIAALIAIAVLGALRSFGGANGGVFDSVMNSIGDALNGT